MTPSPVPPISSLTLGPLPRAIASSSRAEYIAWALGLFGLDHHFGDHVYSADGWDRGKPFPDIYLAAAKGLGVDPAQCLAIEDSPTGARAALGGGDDRCRLSVAPGISLIARRMAACCARLGCIMWR